MPCSLRRQNGVDGLRRRLMVSEDRRTIAKGRISRSSVCLCTGRAEPCEDYMTPSFRIDGVHGSQTSRNGL